MEVNLNLGGHLN